MEDSIKSAAQATAFPADKAVDAIRQVKELANTHSSHVQFWCLTDDGMWPEEAENEGDISRMHLRLFAAVRLVYEYQGPASGTLSDAENRIEKLKNTILEVACALQKSQGLELDLDLQEVLGDRVRELQIKAA